MNKLIGRCLDFARKAKRIMEACLDFARKAKRIMEACLDFARKAKWLFTKCWQVGTSFIGTIIMTMSGVLMLFALPGILLLETLGIVNILPDKLPSVNLNVVLAVLAGVGVLCASAWSWKGVQKWTLWAGGFLTATFLLWYLIPAEWWEEVPEWVVAIRETYQEWFEDDPLAVSLGTVGAVILAFYLVRGLRQAAKVVKGGSSWLVVLATLFVVAAFIGTTRLVAVGERAAEKGQEWWTGFTTHSPTSSRPTPKRPTVRYVADDAPELGPLQPFILQAGESSWFDLNREITNYQETCLTWEATGSDARVENRSWSGTDKEWAVRKSGETTDRFNLLLPTRASRPATVQVTRKPLDECDL